MSLLQLRDIFMSFEKKGKFLEPNQEIKVLRNINLNIEEGEIVVLVGESGCGKTTIGKIITGLLKPTKGQLLFNGKNIYRSSLLDLAANLRKKETKEEKEKRKTIEAENKARLAEFENSVQFVQQDSYAALNPARTIYQSLYAPIANRYPDWTREEVEARIEEVMGLVGMLPSNLYLYKFPHQLSGGQRQRILMARAISLDPKLIVADEPVSMIDVSLRLSILDLMKKLNEQLHIAFVYITHDLSTARYIGQNGRICIMYLGEIVELGGVNEVISCPRHPYTQALLSAVPMPDPVLARQERELVLKSMDVGNLIARKDGCPFYDRCVYAKPECENMPQSYVETPTAKVKCGCLDEVPVWKNTP